MQFYIEKHSSTPVASQIEEQIKLAVMMGTFRNGDTLPSIRDIEKQTGVNRSQIHKAYQSLRRSGLLVLTRGKGTAIATATDAPDSINQNCSQLSHRILTRVRNLGISPTAFARYMSRQAQEDERRSPLLLYVDIRSEIAEETAADISRLWQVPVIGMGVEELKTNIGDDLFQRKILTSHIMCEHIRQLFGKKKPVLIPIEARYSERTIKRLKAIQSNATVLLILLPQPSNRAEFFISQVRRQLKSPKTEIAWAPVRNKSDFAALYQTSGHNYYVVGPGARGEVPYELRKESCIILLYPELDPASLEAARIRAGVVI